MLTAIIVSIYILLGIIAIPFAYKTMKLEDLKHKLNGPQELIHTAADKVLTYIACIFGSVISLVVYIWKFTSIRKEL